MSLALPGCVPGRLRQPCIVPGEEHVRRDVPRHDRAESLPTASVAARDLLEPSREALPREAKDVASQRDARYALLRSVTIEYY